VLINVLDVQGKSQFPLKPISIQNPGIYSFNWEAKTFPSGVYFIQLITDYQTINQKVLLVK